MIYTVTLNPAIDKTVMIPNFSKDTVNRIGSSRFDVGGKGINVSKCLSVLGEESTAIVFLAGNTGRQISNCIKVDPKITVQETWIPQGETRTNLKIIDPIQHTNTDINERGPAIDEVLLTKTFSQLISVAMPDDIVVLSGSLPLGVRPTIYRDWTRLLQNCGVRVFLDADGEALSYGVEGSPFLLKPNRAELSRLCASPMTDKADIIHAGSRLLGKGVSRVAISMGADGGLFLSQEGCFHVLAPRIEPRSTVGAGDSMVAGLAYGTSKGLSWFEQAKLSVALGSASITCNGTEPPSLETVHTILQGIRIESI